ncbi:NAD(P)H-binding protein [Nonomuraea sp. NPDC050394]|uniref:NAD(P)H-binding protein n=1 Tax=Nonomuraea sp. NPDC050394 TaxID=3364363 RepID=UPI003798F195
MTFLITGATGTVGRNVVAELLEAGHQVRALTRNPEKAGLPEGVEVVAGDLAQPETLDAAFDGVTAVHLINFAGDNYEPLENGDLIVKLAEKHGVRRATVLGGRADGPLEQALTGSELEWTLLSPVEFMSNTKQWWAETIRAGEVIKEPFGGRLSAMVHERDIAAVAAKVLVDGGYDGQELVLTGPEAVTTEEKARQLGAAIGKEVAFEELTEAGAREMWAAKGMGPELIEFLVDALGNTPEIGYTVVDTVERVTGRPARTFAQWAQENAAAF